VANVLLVPGGASNSTTLFFPSRGLSTVIVDDLNIFQFNDTFDVEHGTQASYVSCSYRLCGFDIAQARLRFILVDSTGGNISVSASNDEDFGLSQIPPFSPTKFIDVSDLLVALTSHIRSRDWCRAAPRR
jgi:hypothetical protein